MSRELTGLKDGESAIRLALKEWCDNCDTDAFSPALAAEANKELAELVAAAELARLHLVLPYPEEEPIERDEVISKLTTALSRFPVSR